MVEWPICNTGGHIKGGPCIEAIVGRFIETASVKGPPEGCVADLRQPAFHVPGDGAGR